MSKDDNIGCFHFYDNCIMDDVDIERKINEKMRDLDLELDDIISIVPVSDCTLVRVYYKKA